MVSYCFVLDGKGRKLSPTNENRGWVLIRKNKAALINKFPMVIQLFKEVADEKIDQTLIHFNIDDGSKFTGIALVQECQTKNKPVFKGTIEHRTDVKDKMDTRRSYRRYKRSHKKNRPKRFHNRSSSTREGRTPPSIKQKKEATLRLLNKLMKWTRVNHIHLENVMIDIRKLEKGSQPYQWDYQKSNRLDENLRKAALMRDHFTCQDCGNTHCRLEVHHIIPRRLQGSDSIHNFITLCSSCHEQVTGEESDHAERFFKKIRGKKIAFHDAMHVMQGKTYFQQELKKIGPLTLTTGGDTANRRIDWAIGKSHSNDAIVLSQLHVSSKQCHIKDWCIKPMRRRSKKKIDKVNDFHHRDFVRYTKRNGDVYEGYITALYPKKKQCNLTTTEGKVLKRYGINRLKLLWRFNHIYFLNKHE
ncbi:RNA-guided endonuclease IscB [Bacillus taeanensis]|uniref:HNH endonuclease n=1 Tax=Bacillus taeanensis TaxID=273032 RepID=A0A366XWT2_9BACI|nr:RNA-guided endonuclease IscB [Bacillus taeanensis]RBW68604.1 HNH endonuclease [Bacillus taeanensis]